MKRGIMGLIFLLTCSCLATAAQESKPNMLGLGVAFVDQPYKGKDPTIFPLPVLLYEKERFFVRGVKVGYNFYQDDVWEASVFSAPRFMGYDTDDGDDLSGMEDRKWSVDVGAGLAWTIPGSNGIVVAADIAQDILFEHEGQEINCLLSKLFDFRPLFVKPKIGVQWQSEDMIDYYYGVTAAEATGNRASYAPHDAFNYTAGLDAYLYFTPEWALITRVLFTVLDDEITESPLVDDDYSSMVMCGIARKF